jgi:hypothetical protein
MRKVIITAAVVVSLGLLYASFEITRRAVNAIFFASQTHYHVTPLEKP